jgi:hypothetical protein
MTGAPEVDEYLNSMNKKLRRVGQEVNGYFGAEGCKGYVKTIYIGYEIEDEMVAALYGHSDRVEVALALPEDASHPLIVDADHLTWRTMPVAIVITTVTEAKSIAPLINEACERIREGAHDVKRDNDFFIQARRERRRR